MRLRNPPSAERKAAKQGKLELPLAVLAQRSLDEN